MQTQTYRDRLLQLVNSSHSVVTLFECSTPKGSKAFSIYVIDREELSGETDSFSIPQDTIVLDYSELGSTVVRREGDPGPLLISPDTISFLSSGTYHVRSSLGRHKAMLLVSHPSSASVVHEYIARSGVQASVCDLSSETHEKVGQLSSSVAESDEPNYFVVAGLFYSSMSVLLKQRYLVEFGKFPQTVSEVFREICEQVRNNPAGDWSIEAASKLVAYSPQYFSRTFKSAAGHGFHTFVQRVRLSVAISLITQGEISTEVLCTKSGFPSPQAMRETFRAELGLLPRDFKAVKDAADLWPSDA